MDNDERWKKLNVYVSLGGLAICIISLLFVRYSPLILCISFFSLGIAWKGFRNIYKNVEPPKDEVVSNSYSNNTYKPKKKKKSKKKKR